MRIQSENFSKDNIVKLQVLEKVYTYPKHIHQFAELVIPIENELEISVEQSTEILKPGDAAFVFPFQPHSYKSNKVNKIAIIVFSPYVVPTFFAKTDNKVGSKSVFTPKKETLDVIIASILEKDDVDLLELKGSLYLILSDFLSQTELCKSSSKNEIATGIVSYIRENLNDEITLTSLAKSLGYNPNYLSKCISDIFEMNLHSLIASIRVDIARYLLSETEKTGIEICYECGFGSERSFHRQFKSVTGRTPKEYRRAYKAHGKINRGVLKRF